MKSLRERISWSLVVIKEDTSFEKGIRDVDLAGILGISDNTLALYRKGGGVVKASVVEVLSSRYGFDPVWLLRGEGEPWPGARLKYPDACGPGGTDRNQSALSSSVTESCPGYSVNEDHGHPGTITISKDLPLAAAILESGTAYASALHLTIGSFAEAIGLEKMINEKEGDFERFRREFEERLEELVKEVALLRK
jgi:hypothetical protein